MQKRRLQWQKFIVIAIASVSSILILSSIFVRAQISTDSNLPPAKVHPLPQFLADWQDETESGDYFNRIESTPLDYLIWNQFPVKIYVEQPLSASLEKTAEDRRFQEWVATVKKAIADWQVYFPLQEITDRETADIIILRSQPDREIKIDSQTGLFDIPRALTARTTYKFFSKY